MLFTASQYPDHNGRWLRLCSGDANVCTNKQTQMLAVSINNDNHFQPFTLLLSFLFKKKDDYNNLCQPVHVNNKYDLSVSWHEIWFQLIKWSRILNSCRKRANLISLLRSLPPSAAHPPPPFIFTPFIYCYSIPSFTTNNKAHNFNTGQWPERMENNTRIDSNFATGKIPIGYTKNNSSRGARHQYKIDGMINLVTESLRYFLCFFFILFELSVFFHPSAMYIHIGCENMDIFCWEYGITVTRERKMNVQR